MLAFMTMAFAINHRRQAGKLHFDLHEMLRRFLPMGYTERAQIRKGREGPQYMLRRMPV